MNCAFTFWKWINWADQGGCLPYTFLLYNLHLRFLATRSWKLFTYSTVQNPSWEANWFAASQEIPRISQNPKFHYRTHKLPPPVSILGQPNPVHIPTSHLLEIHPNIIHPSMPRSPSGFPTNIVRAVQTKIYNTRTRNYLDYFNCMCLRI